MTVMTVMTAAVFTVLGISVAHGQESVHYKSPIAPSALMNYPKPIPPGWSTAVPPTTLPERIVINHGPGGNIFEHNERFIGYRNAGNAVEIRGECYSACTLVTAHIGKDKLCFAPGSFLAFHAAHSPDGKSVPLATAFMYRQMPAEIRGWIDRHGGWESLPSNGGFWYMHAQELWAFGYPRCP